jgi:hypothetical protein
VRFTVSDPKRIFDNISVLLAEGQFPGKFASVVQEAIEFATAMSARIERDSNGEARDSAGTGSGTAADPAGVVSGEVVSP